ncbi:MAG: hypothetical protein Ta2C_02070 [Candidatus Endomicrobiellum trichonymphae]|uniref:hypothetical protein n=1 Tax=Endomicrobium trichonymphae TaxID=1408204 RepID=UPI0027D3E61E|nr:MAG: hypothetical protein Ta2C_02070 [Candidatus Endomicrobium trichonymphae]
MQKNSILFVTLSAFTVFIWYFFFAQPSEQSYRQMMQLQNTAAVSESGVNKFKNADLNEFQIDDIYAKEEHINIETEQYKAVLTNKGGGGVELVC